MRSPWLRRGLLAALACLVLAAATLAVIPYLAATRIVRDRIAVELSSWSGFRVEIAAPPHIELWPRFRAVLTDVTLSAWDRPSNDPVARAERVEINLSALAALRGDAVFTGSTVINPEVIVVRQPSGIYLPQVAAVGRIAAGIDAAKAVIRSKPEMPDVAALPDEPFGTIRIVDGRVTVAGSQQQLLGSVSGLFEWSNLNRPGRLTGKALVNGETVSFDVNSSSPLLLFAGGATDIAASLTSGPATATFQGKAKFGEGRFIEGVVRVQTPSVADLARWTSTSLPAEVAEGAASISGQITGDARHLKLDAAQIDIQGNRGTGAMEFGLDRDVPGVWGSLDFAWLNAASLVDSFAPLATGTDSSALPMTVDLRLSADRATVGSVALDGVAATVQVKDGLAVFDISDASAFGGTLQAGLRFDSSSENRTVEMRLLASDIDGGALATAAGMKRLLPIGRGTVSVILKSPAETLEGMLERASGSLSASFGPGAIAGLDLPEFLRRSKSGGFFPLSDMAKGNLPIDGLDLEAAISNGVAKINRGVARMGDKVLRISGIVPYMGQSLALTGTLGGADGRNETSFFVGGSWDEPFVTPTFANPPLE